jgi:chlorophyll synthase
MVAGPLATPAQQYPSPAAVLALLKPITWFPPMWAYACGVISAGGALGDRSLFIIGGILLAGPLICGTSQAVNDWFDRHVDAINEPWRVIPSGRMPGKWGLWIAIANSLLSLAIAALLGTYVLAAAVLGLALAWAYSAPPFRLKANGWYGNAAVGISYETLPWLTAAAAALGTAPPMPVFLTALAYGSGAHGIMTLNDFKAMEGDRQMGVNSLPVMLGADRAARLACVVMAVPQAAVIALLVSLGHSYPALAIAALLAAQLAAMVRFLADPKGRAVWYSAVGVGLYVTGMMIAAFALRP